MKKREYLGAISGWVLLLSANLLLLGGRRAMSVAWLSSRQGGTPGQADVYRWQIANLGVGVVTFPVLAGLAVWYVFRRQPPSRWNIPMLILFCGGAFSVSGHLLLAQSWMLDHTDVLPDALSRLLNAAVPGIYTYCVPIFLVLVMIHWARNRRQRNGRGAGLYNADG